MNRHHLFTEAEERAAELIADPWEGNYSPLLEQMCEIDLPKLVAATAQRIAAGESLNACDRWVLDCAMKFQKREGSWIERKPA